MVYKKKHIIKEKVNSLTVNELLLKYKFDNFDLLFVDAEGYDGKIVNDFLRNNHIRPYIIFEYIHIDNKTFTIRLKTLNIYNDDNFINYIKLLFQNLSERTHKDNKFHSIELSFKKSGVNFKISNNDKSNMFNYGIIETLKFITKN